MANNRYTVYQIDNYLHENEDGDFVADGTYTHTATDISGEPAETQAVCAAVWTDAVKAAWKTQCESDTYIGA